MPEPYGRDLVIFSSHENAREGTVFFIIEDGVIADFSYEFAGE